MAKYLYVLFFRVKFCKIYCIIVKCVFFCIRLRKKVIFAENVIITWTFSCHKIFVYIFGCDIVQQSIFFLKPFVRKSLKICAYTTFFNVCLYCFIMREESPFSHGFIILLNSLIVHIREKTGRIFIQNIHFTFEYFRLKYLKCYFRTE